jgi:hypothetical protein
MFRRLLFVVFFAVLGALVAASIAGQLLKPNWQDLGKPTRPATIFVSTSPELIVGASDGTMYRNCGNRCWIQVSDSDIPSVDHWNEEECGLAEPPSLDGLVDLKLECEILPVRSTYRAYAIDSIGSVYQWEKFTGEMSWAEPILYGGIAGAIILFIGVLLIALSSFNDLMSHVRKRALRSKIDVANGDKAER